MATNDPGISYDQYQQQYDQGLEYSQGNDPSALDPFAGSQATGSVSTGSGGLLGGDAGAYGEALGSGGGGTYIDGIQVTGQNVDPMWVAWGASRLRGENRPPSDFAYLSTSSGGSGGGSFGSSSASPSPSPLSPSTSGSGGGGGGSGGGSASSPVQQAYRPQSYVGGTGTQSSSSNTSIGGMLGFLTDLLKPNVPGQQNQQDQIQIPGITQSQSILPDAQQQSSFGGLLSQGPQAYQQQAPSLVGAIQDQTQSMVGAQRGAAGSLFNATGLGGAQAGSSGQQFQGQSPTGTRISSMIPGSSQILQAANQPTSSNFWGGQLAPSGSLGGSMSPQELQNLPMASGVSPQGLPAAGGPVGGLGGGLSSGVPASMQPSAVTGAPTASNSLTPQNVVQAGITDDRPKAGYEMKDVDNPNISMVVGGPEKPKEGGFTGVMKDVDNPELTMSFGQTQPQTQNQPQASVKPEGLQGSGFGFKPNPLVDAVGLGAKHSLVNIGGSIVGKDQKELDAVQRVVEAEQAKSARDNANHPYLAALAYTGGKILPYALGGRVMKGAGLGGKGAGLASNLASQGIQGGLFGLTQYAPSGSQRALNTAIGAGLGLAGQMLLPGLKAVGTNAAGLFGAASAGYAGYQHGNGVVDTAWKTALGAVTGYGAGKGGALGLQALAKYVKGAPTVAAKETAPPVAQAAIKETGFVAKSKAQMAAEILGKSKSEKAAAMRNLSPQGARFFDNADELQAAKRSMSEGLDLKDILNKPTQLATVAKSPEFLSTATNLLGISGSRLLAEQLTNMSKAPAVPQVFQTQPPNSPEAIKQHNAKMLESVQDVPMRQMLTEPEKQQLQQATAKDPQLQQYADLITLFSQKEWDRYSRTQEGRQTMLDIVANKQGPEAAQELRDMFNKQDGVGRGGSGASTPMEAIEWQMKRAEQIQEEELRKKQEEASVKSRSRGMLQPGSGEAAKGVSEDGFLTMAKLQKMNQSYANAVRTSVIQRASPAVKRSAFSSQIMRLLLSYLMKRPGVQSTLRRPDEVGQASRLVYNQLLTG